MTLLLAFNLLAPIVAGLQYVIQHIDGYTHNLGWSLVLMAALVRLVFWPLNAMQFKSMAKMQALQPQMKALQAKYKADPQRLNAEMMAVYKANGTSPFASCLPLALQLPILFSIYQAINLNHEAFTKTSWGWIGTPFAANYPNIFAASLAAPDLALLALYVISMFFSVKLSSPPSSDPQQAQQQQIMALISPLMIAFIGRKWPSGLMLFWLTSNVLQMAQQFYMLKTTGVLVLEPPPLNAPTIEAGRISAPTRDAANSPRRQSKGPRRSSR